MNSEQMNMQEVADAIVIRGGVNMEALQLKGVYHVQARGPIEERRHEYCVILERLEELRARCGQRDLMTDEDAEEISVLEAQLAEIPIEDKWEEPAVAHNLVTTVGRNDLWDKYLAGSSYTAAWFMGLIDAAGYSAVAAADTMASHGGWNETTNYSQANRGTMNFSAAASGNKATANAVLFNINANKTIKGPFVTTSDVKGGNTGVLFSAGLFTNGDKVVQNGDQLQATYNAVSS